MTRRVPRQRAQSEREADPTAEPTQPNTGPHEADCGVLDVDGDGRYLNVGRSKVYELDARHELPAPVQVGRVRRWVGAEIEAWLLHGAPKRAVWDRTWPKVRKEVMGR